MDDDGGDDKAPRQLQNWFFFRGKESWLGKEGGGVKRRVLMIRAGPVPGEGVKAEKSTRCVLLN